MTDIVERLLERSQNLWTTDRQLLDNMMAKESAETIQQLRFHIILLECALENLTSRNIAETEKKHQALVKAVNDFLDEWDDGGPSCEAIRNALGEE